MMEGDPYPVCTDLQCEVAEDTPISIKESECIHCGTLMRRNQNGRWEPINREE